MHNLDMEVLAAVRSVHNGSSISSSSSKLERVLRLVDAQNIAGAMRQSTCQTLEKARRIGGVAHVRDQTLVAM